MSLLKISERPPAVGWDYDEDADVLNLSLGDSRRALGVDIGAGVVLRYDDTANEVIGLTLIGLRARLLRELAGSS